MGLDTRLRNPVRALSQSSRTSICVALDLWDDKNHRNYRIFIFSDSNLTRLPRSVIHVSTSPVVGATPIREMNVMFPSYLFSIVCVDLAIGDLRILAIAVISQAFR